jgi:hypothetical protein
MLAPAMLACQPFRRFGHPSGLLLCAVRVCKSMRNPSDGGRTNKIDHLASLLGSPLAFRRRALYMYYVVEHLLSYDIERALST